MTYFTLPNILSNTRFFLAPLMVFLILELEWFWAAIFFIYAIFSDLLDGYLARLWQQTSALGGFLDHCSDAILVVAILSAQANLNYIPWFLPPLIALAFVQYTLDSKVLAGQALRTSKLGRYNGIAYYCLAALPLLINLFNLPIAAVYIYYLSYLLCLSTMLSILDRFISLQKKLKQSS